MGNSVKTPNIPSFEDAMANFRAQIFYDLYVHVPGTIVAFNRATGLATVQPGLRRVYPTYTVPGGQTTKPYPQVANVMVFTLQGGGASVGADPAVGDPCLLLVADRNLDAWRQNGGQQAPLSDRAHHLSDCFALVGFNPLSAPLVSARLAGEAGIADALAKVTVKQGRLKIGNNLTDLATILKTLFTVLASDPGLNGTSHAALTAANTALDTLFYP